MSTWRIIRKSDAPNRLICLEWKFLLGFLQYLLGVLLLVPMGTIPKMD